MEYDWERGGEGSFFDQLEQLPYMLFAYDTPTIPMHYYYIPQPTQPTEHESHIAFAAPDAATTSSVPVSAAAAPAPAAATSSVPVSAVAAPASAAGTSSVPVSAAAAAAPASAAATSSTPVSAPARILDAVLVAPASVSAIAPASAPAPGSSTLFRGTEKTWLGSCPCCCCGSYCGCVCLST